MPKTEEQGQATKTLLGKIFGMTGKRREVINLNGSGVEDPQAQSLLERMAAGDKGDGEVRWLFDRLGQLFDGLGRLYSPPWQACRVTGTALYVYRTPTVKLDVRRRLPRYALNEDKFVHLEGYVSNLFVVRYAVIIEQTTEF